MGIVATSLLLDLGLARGMGHGAADRAQGGKEVPGRGGLEDERRRVRERRDGELPGVEKGVVRLQSRAQERVAHTAVSGTGVQVVAHNGMSGVGEVDAKLVSSASMRFQLQQRHAGGGSQETVGAGCWLAPLGDPHTAAVMRVGSQRPQVLPCRRARSSPRKRQVGLVDLPRAQGLHEKPVRVRVASQEDKPRGTDVQTMDEPELAALEAPARTLNRIETRK